MTGQESDPPLFLSGYLYLEPVVVLHNVDCPTRWHFFERGFHLGNVIWGAIRHNLRRPWPPDLFESLQAGRRYRMNQAVRPACSAWLDRLLRPRCSLLFNHANGRWTRCMSILPNSKIIFYPGIAVLQNQESGFPVTRGAVFPEATIGHDGAWPGRLFASCSVLLRGHRCWLVEQFSPVCQAPRPDRRSWSVHARRASPRPANLIVAHLFGWRTVV